MLTEDESVSEDANVALDLVLINISRLLSLLDENSGKEISTEKKQIPRPKNDSNEKK